jgi:outer membrane protein assembly factor BamB
VFVTFRFQVSSFFGIFPAPNPESRNLEKVMKYIARSFVLFAAAISLCANAAAANWPQWRGPHFNGSSDEKNLPAHWSKTSNIAWNVDLPGPGASTPIIWEDRVFISSTDLSTKSLQAICLDRKTGKVLWQHQIGMVMQRDNRSTFASPSPATDGKFVVFFYGNGDLVAFDLAGTKLWSRNIQKDYGEFAFLWTFSSTPVLYAGKLYLQVLQRDVAVSGRGRSDAPNVPYLLAMDPATGKTLWREVRPSHAVAESREAFTTPIPYEFNGRKQLLVAGGDELTGHDLETGKEVWRWGTWNPSRIGHWRLVPSPVAGNGIVLACAPKGDPIYAIKADRSGTLDESAIAWKSDAERTLSADVPTPAFYKGDFIVLGDVRKTLLRVDPLTGKAKWSLELPGRKKLESSPTVADGKIYFMDFGGDVVVADAEKGAIINTIPMGEPGDNEIRSSIAVAQGQLYIRTNKKLFCVGKGA